MIPGTCDLLGDDAIYRGDDYTFTVTLYEDDAQTIPIDVSAATLLAQVRDKESSITGTIITTFVCTVEGAENNIIRLTLDDTNGANGTKVAPGTYWWDLEIDNGGDKHTWLKGQIAVLPDISEAP